MKTNATHFLIYVRPTGSKTWTMHIGRGSLPARFSNPEKANSEAMEIVEHTEYCARVVPVTLPHELDDHIFATLADGDTTYTPAKPLAGKGSK